MHFMLAHYVGFAFTSQMRLATTRGVFPPDEYYSYD